MQKIILASQSPRRKELLELAEIPFEIIVNHTHENYPPNLSIENIPIHIAQQKANAVAAKHSNRTILAADTIVTIHNKILGKPKDKIDALTMLQTLSNNTHTVITGVCIKQENKEITFQDQTQVTFHTLTAEQIIHYINTYKPYDKAGAYGIQDWIGVIGIKSIRGDFYNVMGLPISRVVKALEAF